MNGPVSKPLENYIESFVVLFKTQRDKLLIDADDDIVIINFEGNTYRVAHFDDLLWEFKTYFSDDLSDIYTEVPSVLWERLFEEHVEITEEDLIIDIYSAWKFYWEHQADDEVYANEHVFNKLKDESWKEFEQLVEKIKNGPGNIIKNASKISDINLIPVLAIAIKMQFKNEEEFYKECVEMLIEEFPDTFSEDEEFEEVDLQPENPGKERYFIYQIDDDF